VRLCIVGGGLAGSMLAWRLGNATGDWQVDLVAGQNTDATSASGGAVRAYETDAEQRRLATASLLELLASRTLRLWSGFRPTGAAYLRPDPTGLAEAAADIEHLLPGSVDVVNALDGWAVLPPGAAAIVERRAGYTAPDRWRDAVLADARRVTVSTATIRAIRHRSSGTVACDGREYDVVVLAAGAWTPALLRANGFPADGYRTKTIQYAKYPVADWRPPQFVDEITGLYGRPAGDWELLLGLPTEHWDVLPDRPPVTPGLADEAARLAGKRFPGIRLGPAGRSVVAADCYTDRPVLGLRPVAPSLWTFSGGSGGSVKTVLAASQRAAVQLLQL
jgi:glycine/D-amino acid oxidase-like deaminating enzyme